MAKKTYRGTDRQELIRAIRDDHGNVPVRERKTANGQYEFKVVGKPAAAEVDAAHEAREWFVDAPATEPEPSADAFRALLSPPAEEQASFSFGPDPSLAELAEPIALPRSLVTGDDPGWGAVGGETSEEQAQQILADARREAERLTAEAQQALDRADLTAQQMLDDARAEIAAMRQAAEHEAQKISARAEARSELLHEQAAAQVAIETDRLRAKAHEEIEQLRSQAFEQAAHAAAEGQRVVAQIEQLASSLKNNAGLLVKDISCAHQGLRQLAPAGASRDIAEVALLEVPDFVVGAPSHC
jgi:F0F1-type ATP synthase membrane subunit b/b'